MKKYFITAFLAHIFLLLPVIVLTHNLTSITAQKYMPAYIFHPVRKILYSKNSLKHAPTHSIQQSFQPEITALHAEHDDKLLQLLHEAISHAQDYPDTALELKESGMVSIGLTLSPDGTVSQVSLIKSSGYSILDQAAVNTVKSLPPLVNAKNYLTEKKEFSV